MGEMFDNLDPERLTHVSAIVGTHMAASSAIAISGLVHDKSIDPATLAAGIVRAHLLGAASALAGAAGSGALVIDDAKELGREAGDFVVAALSSMRPH